MTLFIPSTLIRTPHWDTSRGNREFMGKIIQFTLNLFPSTMLWRTAKYSSLTYSRWDTLSRDCHKRHFQLWPMLTQSCRSIKEERKGITLRDWNITDTLRDVIPLLEKLNEKSHALNLPAKDWFPVNHRKNWLMKNLWARHLPQMTLFTPPVLIRALPSVVTATAIQLALTASSVDHLFLQTDIGCAKFYTFYCKHYL